MPDQHITPSSSLTKQPLMHPPTEKRPFDQAQQVIALFRDEMAGTHTEQDPWKEFQLAPGEYAEVERLLILDEELWGYVDDKVRYDYNPSTHRLVIRTPTTLHSLFIAKVEHALHSSLKTLREQPTNTAPFARKVHLTRHTTLYLPVENDISNAQSRHDPDASFRHQEAKYPGVILECCYAQKRKAVDRLAENYLLDSDASVNVVIGLDIGYDREKKSEPTLSVWRTQILHTAEGDELAVVKVVADEPFRNKQGEPTKHPGLQLSLADFACEVLTQGATEEGWPGIVLSTKELCGYLADAERQLEPRDGLVRTVLAPGVKKRRREVTPPLEEIT